MSRFFVGQRVRVKSAMGRAKPLIGSEARIIGETVLGEQELWVLDIPDRLRGDHWYCTKEDASDCLEPILDQRHEACDEDFKRDLARLLERQGVLA